MEVNEAEKIVIAKPVPSRPGGSNFKSFSELLAGAINASPSNTCYETPVTAIRPRTVRFKPAANNALIGVVSSESKPLRNLVHYPSEEVLKSEKTSNVVYKPMAKLVSKTTVTLLANLRSTELIQEQALAQAERHVQRENLVKNQSGLRPESRNNLLFESGKEKKVESSKTSSAATLDEDQRSLSHSTISDRPSYDGYNWRKYGQKLVKGSEFPRSYYKCTHPNCPVKKKVERSLDGQIAEIVYKGEHSHPKPQPLKRNSSDVHCQGNVGNESNNPLRSNQPSDRNEGRVGTSETRNEYGFSAHSSYSSRVPSFIDPITTRASNVGMSTLDIYSGHSGDFEDRRSKGPEAESYEPKSKRRKSENHSSEVGTSGEGTLEPLVIVQNPVDSEIIRDGFRWRKYGQKVVKGNQYPRSYYRCTSLKCNVRKYVERTSDDDPNAFITTYEGKHNHEMPIKSTHSAGAKTSSKADDIS